MNQVYVVLLVLLFCSIALTGPAIAQTEPLVERHEDDIVVSIPEAAVDGDRSIGIDVTIEETEDTIETGATLDGNVYDVAIPLGTFVPEAPETNLDSANVTITHQGEVLVTEQVDLRTVRLETPYYEGSTLVVPITQRGIAEDSEILLRARGDETLLLDTERRVRGGNTELVVPREDTESLGGAGSYQLTAIVDGDTVSEQSVTLGVESTIDRSYNLTYVDEELVVVVPQANPTIGTGPVTVDVETDNPQGLYRFEGYEHEGTIPIPEDVLGAAVIALTIEEGGSTVHSAESIRPDSGPTVALAATYVNETQTLQATEPEQVNSYDFLLVGDVAENGSVVHIESLPTEQLTTSGGTPVPESLAPMDPDESYSMLLVGANTPPTVPTIEIDDPEEHELLVPVIFHELFGIVLESALGAVLLVLSMIGAGFMVALSFAYRYIRPRVRALDAMGVISAITLGAVGGVGMITVVQATTALEPAFGVVATIGGYPIGVGAVVIGLLFGALSAAGFRLWLVSAGYWPTRGGDDGPVTPVTVTIDDTTGDPVTGVTVTATRLDDEGDRTTSVTDEETTVYLSPGKWNIAAEAGKRTLADSTVTISDDSSGGTIQLSVRRPVLHLEPANSENGEPIETPLTVTTNDGYAKRLIPDGGSGSVRLPPGTTATTVHAHPNAYEETIESVPIKRNETTLDLDISPVRGTLTVSVEIDGMSAAGNQIQIQPTDELASSLARPQQVTLGSDGTTKIDLPGGEYRIRHAIPSCNEPAFQTTPKTVTIDTGSRQEVALESSFQWSLTDDQRSDVTRLRNEFDGLAAMDGIDTAIPKLYTNTLAEYLDAIESLETKPTRIAQSDVPVSNAASAGIRAVDRAYDLLVEVMKVDAVRSELTAASDNRDRDPGPGRTVTADEFITHLEGGLGTPSVKRRVRSVKEHIEGDSGTDAVASAMIDHVGAVSQERQTGVGVAAFELVLICYLDATEALYEQRTLRKRLG